MRDIYLLFLLTFLSNSLYSAKLPALPNKPSLPNSSSVSNTKEKATKDSKAYKVELTNFKGSKVKGNISLKSKGITIKNKKDEFTFYKKLLYKEIKIIEFLIWGEGKVSSTKHRNSSGGTLYVFHPTKFKIITKANEEFFYYGRIRELEKIKLSNALGYTMLYSIFYDYWTTKGYWKNSKSKVFSHNKQRPNPRSLTRIEFIDLVVPR